MSPILFEALMFLKSNKEYWHVHVVTRAMNSSTDGAMSEELKSRDYEIFYDDAEIDNSEV
jgi:hypothetical protein